MVQPAELPTHSLADDCAVAGDHGYVAKPGSPQSDAELVGVVAHSICHLDRARRLPVDCDGNDRSPIPGTAPPWQPLFLVPGRSQPRFATDSDRPPGYLARDAAPRLF